MPADTRQLILDTAIRLFEERGYAGTTMRAIATEAGVAPSNAYYWFASKDQLVQEFYRRIQVAHRERSAAALARRGPLTERLLAVERAGIEVMAPYHGFGSAFVGTAIVPGPTVSPFSEESAGRPRAVDGDLSATSVEGSSPSVPAKLAPVLPDLLWLAHLSVTLYWVIDTSPGQRAHATAGRALGGDAWQRHRAGPPAGRDRAGPAGRIGARRGRTRAGVLVNSRTAVRRLRASFTELPIVVFGHARRIRAGSEPSVASWACSWGSGSTQGPPGSRCSRWVSPPGWSGACSASSSG